MISPELLQILRCPINPQSELKEEGHALVCACGVRFPVKDGFPCLIKEEAQLPPGCEAVGDLPCQAGRKK